MFKRFNASTDCSTSTQVKASVQRAIKSQILEKHTNITEDMLDELFPKKASLVQYKVGSHLMLYCRRHEPNNDNHDSNDDDNDVDRTPSDEPVLFQHRDGPILPTLKFIHQYIPTLQFTYVTVDQGAIPFLLGGANIGSYMPPDGIEQDSHGFDIPGLHKGDGVVIFAEGKKYPIAVGVMTMNSNDM
jgi:malignant T-cell-amplified sequence